MEMLEEGQNQPEISAKRIKFEEIAEEEEEEGGEDRISALPDCLLLEILSRLPYTEEAIRTGTLSTRWKHIWTWLPVLIFMDSYSEGVVSEFGSFVDKTLTQCRQLKLKKFVLSTGFGPQTLSQINSCICYAIRCNVEKLHLRLWDEIHGVEFRAEFQLDQFFFTNSSFTDLEVEAHIWNRTGVISWKNLRSLQITKGILDEDLIENILSGSPLLETLVLECCQGFSRLDITSKSVKKLVLSGYGEFYYNGDILEINAPYILSLTIEGELELWDLWFLNVSSLIEAELDYYKSHNLCDEGITQKEEMLESLILDLSHVKELKIGRLCSEELSQLRAKGFVVPSNIKIRGVNYNWIEIEIEIEIESESESDLSESGDW